MDDFSWVKPPVTGAAVGTTDGVLLFGVIGFTVGRSMTTGGADRVSPGMAHATLIAAMVPVCPDLSANNADRAARIVLIHDTPIEGRREATVPGSERAQPRSGPCLHERARTAAVGLNS